MFPACFPVSVCQNERKPDVAQGFSPATMDMDPYYKKMMLWLAAAFAATIIAALIIVELVLRQYPE